MSPGSSLLRDRVYRAIRSEILECTLAPGQHMRECALAERLEVSRQPVRYALQRLEKERLVIVHPRQGYRVSPVLLDDAKSLLDFRIVLEPACAAAACAEASDEELAALDRFRAFDNSGGPQGFVGYNRAFHVALAMASRNGRMSQTARELLEQSDRLVTVSFRMLDPLDQPRIVAEHRAIIDAVQSRDRRQAARLVRLHVAGARRRILEALERAEQSPPSPPPKRSTEPC